MKYFKWLDGRQEQTKYKKMCLWSFKVWKFGFDCYILKYTPWSILQWHTDPVKNGKHWRKNITLKGHCAFFTRTKQGLINSYIGTNAGWFRPDIREHCLHVYGEPVTKLSLGFVKFNK